MTKVISLFATCFVISSCNQQPKATNDTDLAITKDSIKNSTPIKIDRSALNIDGLTASPQNFKLLLENDHVRMLEYSLKPGEKDTPHTHPAKAAYVVSGGKIKVYLENGATEIFDEKAGTADWSGGAGKHYVENIGNTTITIVLTEIK